MITTEDQFAVMAIIIVLLGIAFMITEQRRAKR